jgi:hypothetical protein
MRLILFIELAALFLLCAIPPASRAQESPAAFVERQKTEAKEEVVRLLKSGMPRDRAWAAHLCMKHGLKESVPELIAALNPAAGTVGWSSFGPGCPEVKDLSNGKYFSEEQLQFIANQAVLDALIRLDARPTAEELRFYFSSQPNETIILLARKPFPNESALLNFPTPGFRNFCLKVLADAHSKMLAIQLLSREIALNVTVAGPNFEFGGMPEGTVGIVYSLSTPCRPADFPDLRFYELVFSPKPDWLKRTIISKEPLKWIEHDYQSRRLMSWEERQSHYKTTPEFLRDRMREMLDDPEALEQLPDFPTVDTIVRWKGPTPTCRRIAATCARTRAAFLELKQKYVAKNILTQAEADAIPLKIKLEIVDARPSGGRALPKIECSECPEK